VNEPPDPGWRDADRTRGLDFMLEVLDHSETWRPLVNTRRALYRALRPKPGARILDVGCGTGYDAAMLAPRVQPGGSVEGADSSPRMVAIARDRYGDVAGLSFRQGGVEALPFADEQFDATFAVRTLQYMDDPMPALREMARVTKPAGRVAVVEGAMSVMDLPIPELADRIMGQAWGIRTHGFATELCRLLREAGLIRVRVIPVATAEYDAYPYFLKYALESADGAVEAAVATEDEVAEWKRQVEERVKDGWFSADCLFIAIGTVPRGVKL
jgi:ubiquinone/menaquinone biosynthesis C-methylase UbiE